jgi:hypothetical protein
MARLFPVVLVAICLTAASAAFASGDFAGLSLSVSKETAPPGGMAQVKIFLTEPKPISTGGGKLTFDAYDAVLGIALAPEAPDAGGVALVRGTAMDVSVISPSGNFGTDADYPILSVVGHVPDGTPAGVKFPMTVDPSALHLFDASGAVYPVEVKQGHLVTGNGVAIGDVNPGSAVLPAGAVVTITGSNFSRDTKIKFDEAKIDAVRYVSPTRIDVVLGSSADMHGMFVKATNPDGSQATYYSYQRTFAALRSADPVLQYAVPLVSPPSRSTAVVAFAAPAANVTNGVALQNIGTSDVTATLELLDEAGSVIGTAQMTVPPSRFVVQSLSELFGSAPAGASSVLVSSPIAPIEVLGLTADRASGTAMPVLPQ